MSSTVQEVSTTKAATPKATYAQGQFANGLLFTAGFGPHDPTTGQIVGSTIQEQTGAALSNIRAVLEAAGLSVADVVKVNVHLQRLAQDFAGFQEVYQEFFVEPYPVRTTVGSDLPGFLVEIEVVAAADGRQPGSGDPAGPLVEV